MWHRYISKLYGTIYLHNKCIVYIVFFRSGVSSKWVAKNEVRNKKSKNEVRKTHTMVTPGRNI